MLTLVQKRLAIGAMVAICLAVDYVLGPYFTFPVTFILPVMFAAWWFERWASLTIATLMALARIGLGSTWELPIPDLVTYVVINAIIREIVFVVLVLLVDRVATQQWSLEREVKVLEGLLPVCAFCKKIRNDDDGWESMENYISRHSAAEFSHTFCPDCIQKHYGEYRGPSKKASLSA